MASKKYNLLFIAFMLLATATFAQSGSGYDIYDSSVVPSKRMPQQNEFWNNSYNFPAKPRNQVEVGFSVGVPTLSSDVSAKIPTLGYSAHIRKAFGYLFSLRLEYLYANTKGMNWKASENFNRNPAWNAYASPQRNNNGLLEYRRGFGGTLSPNPDFVYYNYKTRVQDLGLQGIFTLNNIRFHKQKTGFVLYGGVGIGATLYKSMVNAQNDNGGSYATLFNSVYANNSNSLYKNRKDILKALKDGMDDSYETPAENNGIHLPKLGDNILRPSGTALVGVAFKLGKRVNLAIENRHTFVKDDLLEGQQWQEHAPGAPVQTRDYDSYNYASIGLNFNLGGKAVEPLWWLNPLDYAYGEINNPKHMKLPKPVFDDADGDGVIDQLDREPNTPAGCPVDTHGVTKDTDGDGVPDCKDKQLITPTECQPVDADGVGKCPDPECCKNMAAVPANICPTDYPSLSFKGNSMTLTNDTKALLATTAAKMKANPTCNININGYPEASKASQAVCQRRVDAIKMYLVEKEGISADRITTNCEVGGGEKNTVDIKSN